MNLNDLSAQELARIDAICLEYENDARSGNAEPIENIVARLGGKHADILRAELESVRDELASTQPVATAAQHGGEVRLGGERVAAVATAAATRGFQHSKTIEFQPPPLVDALPRQGDTLGPYVLGEVLGRGGMGIVFKATDTRLDRQVAIKMLTVQGARKAELAERFQSEAKAVAALSHPNIVELFDVGVVGNVPYAVMEYLHGEVLMDRFVGQPMDAAEVRRLGAQIADALAAAHAGGVIHRDLKPHNIMLVQRQGGDSSTLRKTKPPADAGDEQEPRDQTTMVKLVDFGLSRQPRGTTDPEATQTREGVILGTPGYMSPEQARGEPVTAAADIFGLGCVLFEAFYGSRAFGGETAAARYAAVLESTPAPDPLRRRDDPALAELIDRCLAKRISERPSSAAEIARQLREVGGRANAAPAGSALSSVSRRRFGESVVGGLLGALAGQWVQSERGNELIQVRRVAVVSLLDNETPVSSEGRAARGETALGDRDLAYGEQLSGMLARELQRMPELQVRPYRPVYATTYDEFRELGDALDVDAIITGTYLSDVRGSKRFLEITLQMVSAQSGAAIWSETIVTEEASSLLEQSELTRKMAAAVGHRLRPSDRDGGHAAKAEALGCLAKGHTYLDSDSGTSGLVRAIKCFEHATEVDPRYPDAHAGLALTLIAAATRGEATNPTTVLAQISQARESVEYALELDARSWDARLGKAMLAWQTLYRYDLAREELQAIATAKPNDWRVHHQLGLIQLASDELNPARQSLVLASRLNPQSIMIRTDIARLDWYGGNESRAIEHAKQLQRTFPAHALASGLLVDIHEHLQQFDLAAREHPGMDASAGRSPQVYFAARRQALDALPYGPFGAMLNAAILNARAARSAVDEETFARLVDAQLPALPLLLARHPTFSATRALEAAEAVLPRGSNSFSWLRGTRGWRFASVDSMAAAPGQ